MGDWIDTVIRCALCDDTWSECPNRNRHLSLPRVWHPLYASPSVAWQAGQRIVVLYPDNMVPYGPREGSVLVLRADTVTHDGWGYISYQTATSVGACYCKIELAPFQTDVAMDELTAVDSSPPDLPFFQRLRADWRDLCKERVSNEYAIVVYLTAFITGMICLHFSQHHNTMGMGTMLLLSIATLWVSGANDEN